MLLALSEGRPALPFFDLVRHTAMPGVGVRLDMGGGLDTSARDGLALTAESGLTPDVTIPLAKSGDLGYAREGRFVLDRNAIAFVDREIVGRYGCGVGLLADPSAILTRTLCAPGRVLAQVQDALAETGLPIQGWGCSFHADLSTLYDMMWVYMVSQGYPYAFSAAFAETFACREWLWPETPRHPALPPLFQHPLDGITRLRYLGDQPVRPTFSRDFHAWFARAPALGLELSLDFVAYTDVDGWHTMDRRGNQAHMDPGELCRTIRDAPRSARIACIIDPGDIAHAENDRGGPHADEIWCRGVRVLPYPYDRYLAVNSDADHTTPGQFEKMAECVCGQHGLPLAASAFLMSRTDGCLAWQRRGPAPATEKETTFERLARWASRGLLDTIHGLVLSCDTIRWQPIVPSAEGDPVFEPELPFCPDGYDGLLVSVDRAGEAVPELELKTADGVSVSLSPSLPQRGEGGCHFFFPTDGLEPGGAPWRQATVRGLTPGVRVTSLQTALGTRLRVQQLLDTMRQASISAPVMTWHGGGEGVKRFGACLTAEAAHAFPDEAVFALDRPGTPYHLLDLFRDFGVRFFNLKGAFLTSSLVHIDSLIETHALPSGETVCAFRRFSSNRHQADGLPDRWMYGKQAASGQAFPTAVEDALERLHWTAPGHGGILYTHLGHKAGNQVSARLGWPEEAYGVWERLASFMHDIDTGNPVPFRLWVATASEVLAYAAVRKGLADAIECEDDTVRITSWDDPDLGCHIPDAKTFGTAWLHGVTLAVRKPERVRVLVDGQPLVHYTVNPRDSTGTPSITLVDGRRQRCLLPDPDRAPEVLSVEERPSENGEAPATMLVPPTVGETEIPLPPVSLWNATHWTFEILVPRQATAWKLGFRTDTGYWYDAGTTEPLCWAVPGLEAGAWQQVTLALNPALWTAGCGGRGTLPPPTGNVVAVRARTVSDRGEAPVRFRGIRLLLPRPPAATPKGGGSLAGTVRRCGTGEPVQGRTIRAEIDGQIHTATTDARGVYVFSGLPARRARLRIEEEGSATFVRGPVAFMTCDQWDWDIFIQRETPRAPSPA